MFDKETEMLCITEVSRRRYNYPRPYSEPPSPSNSRPTTPGASLHGSDDEGIDEEREVTTLLSRYDVLSTLKQYIEFISVFVGQKGLNLSSTIA